MRTKDECLRRVRFTKLHILLWQSFGAAFRRKLQKGCIETNMNANDHFRLQPFATDKQYSRLEAG